MTQLFSQMNPVTVRASVCGEILVLTLDNPPVNGLSHAVRHQLFEHLQAAGRSAVLQAVVIHGAGRCFSAGGDIREMGTHAGTAFPGLSADIHPAIEGCGKPVIAALHGLAFGGGLETALACNYRIACAATRVALPEVSLGIIPLSGTQRLPRLVGLQMALEMIVEAKEYKASELSGNGLFDLVVEDTLPLVEASLHFARGILSTAGPHPAARNQFRPELNPRSILETWRSRLERAGDSQARLGALSAISAAYDESGFAAGLARAKAIYDDLYHSAAAADKRAAFLAKRPA